jgi:hypothetical protein
MCLHMKPVWNLHHILLHVHHHVQKHIQKMAMANFNYSKRQNYQSVIFSHNKHLNAAKTRQKYVERIYL